MRVRAESTETDEKSAAVHQPRIRVFGVMAVEVDGTPVSIGGSRQRRLLALLAFRSGAIASLDWLGEHLWSDEDRPVDMVSPLRTYVSRLRRSFPPEARDWIETEPAGYRLNAPDGAIDIDLMHSLRQQANRARELGDPLAALDLLDDALATWRGGPYSELVDFDWALPTIQQLEHDRLEMMEERWEASLALGRHTQITGELAAFTTEHGMRDRAVRQYALALHRSGRTAEGLRAIGAFRTRLAEESGLDPSPGVLELEQAMLVGDKGLTVEKTGRPLRGYRLLEEIGNGAFSIVWRAVQPSVGRDVAIKQIRAELASQPEFIRRFETEAHMVAAIEHPHIVPLIDYWRDPDSAYLVLRWLRGGTLERRLDDGHLTLSEATQLVHQVGGALASAHAKGVVHRDVKPANILFDHDGNTFLSDFGIALEFAESNGPEAALSPGSPAYAAPEQQRREALGPEADIYSFGVVVAECLDATTTSAVVDSVIRRACAPDRDDRFSSIVEFVDAFTEAASPTVAEAGSSARPTASEVTANPYKGLSAFGQGDDRTFFGRERIVHELVTRLSGSSIESRCVVLVGPSGSGKSSVAHAGLLPAIRRGAVEGSEQWFVSTMVPGVDVYESLAAAILRVAVDPPPTLVEQLRDGPRGILRGVRSALRSEAARVFLAIDQFEELFVGRGAADADDFLHALAIAIEDPASPLRVVATIRADFYDRPLAHPAFARIVKACALEVTPLAGDELERAIVEPARQVGVDFEPGLVSTIATATAGRAGGLPLMQYALSELFDRRTGSVLTTKVYLEIGGLAGAVSSRAESLYLESGPAERSAIRRLFGQLTDPMSESGDVRRRVLSSNVDLDPNVRAVIDRFGSARLLTFDRDARTREPTVEVAHEALLREWPRLAGWLVEDRELLRAVAAVSSAADAWDVGGRATSDLYRGWRLHDAVELNATSGERFRELDRTFIEASAREADVVATMEMKRLRRLRRLTAAMAGALVVAMIAGGLALRQTARADDEAHRAQQAAAEAELATLISRSAAQVDENSDLAVLLALEAHRRAPSHETEYAILDALGSKTLINRTETFPPLGDEACRTSTALSDGSVEFAVADERLVSRSTTTGVVKDHGPSPVPCVQWFGDAGRNRRVAVSQDGGAIWLGPFDGDWQVERTLETPIRLESRSWTDADRLVVRRTGAGRAGVLLLDGTSGDISGEIPSEGDGLVSTTASADGEVVVASYEHNFDAEGSGVTIVADGLTGREVARIRTEKAFASLAIDGDARELVGAAGSSSSIMTFDLDTGELLAEVETASTAGLAGQRGFGLTVRSDGLLLLATRNQIEILDRRLGPVGEPIAIQGASDVRVRPDGSVVLWFRDRSQTTVEFDSNALVLSSWAIEPFAELHMASGRAVVVPEPAGTPELIDLATGERAAPELRMSDGTIAAPPAAFPHGSGLWTVGRDELRYWEGDRDLTAISLSGSPETGNRNGNRIANVIGGQRIGYEIIEVADLDERRVTQAIAAPFAATAVPTSQGGVHVLFRDGRLHTYDDAGGLVAEMFLPERDATQYQIDPTSVLGTPISIDDSSGMLAMRGLQGEALIIDPAAARVEVLPGVDDVVTLGFARHGEMLVIGREDGAVSLWDVRRGERAGQVAFVGGAGAIGVPWYDENDDSVWIASASRLQQISLTPDTWVSRACSIVAREFTSEEWARYVPGDGEPESLCT